MNRNQAVAVMLEWLNSKTDPHKEIIDTYNTINPLPRGYKMTMNDAWCAATVSAAFVKAGNVNIMYPECGCGKMIEGSIKKGIWIEADDIMPEKGDLIIYDWNDTTGSESDNTSGHHHVGMVTMTYPETNTFDVVEGNKDGKMGKRRMTRNGKFIRGFIRPKYDDTTAVDQDLTLIAKEVIQGKWGNGQARKKALSDAGYDYNAVQAIVNVLCQNTSQGLKDLETVAREVIRGNWGNGQERKDRLTRAGYNYTEVQTRVNEIMKGL